MDPPYYSIFNSQVQLFTNYKFMIIF